jgi:flavodoxin
MRKRFWTLLTILATAVIVFTGISLTSATNAQAASDRKTLVVYFSRTKGVYGGSLKKGNTAQVADFIKQKTGADSYEIVPKKAYPNSYNKTTKVAQREQNRNARPAIKGQLPNVKKYDTVFIGAPIWWGEYPMVVRTFLDKESGLNGKTLIPFTTSEGSGLGNTSSQLKKQFPNAKVRKGFTAQGTTVKNNPASVQRQVNKWLDGLGY